MIDARAGSSRTGRCGNLRGAGDKQKAQKGQEQQKIFHSVDGPMGVYSCAIFSSVTGRTYPFLPRPYPIITAILIARQRRECAISCTAAVFYCSLFQPLQKCFLSVYGLTRKDCGPKAVTPSKLSTVLRPG